MRLPISLLAATALLTGCMTAPGYTEKEQSIIDNLEGGKYQPASRQARDAIDTQSLLAQATFWSGEAQLNPADLEAALRLTAAVRKMGNPKQAVDIAQMARQMHPKDPYLLAEYAASLIADERGAEAIKPLQTGLRTTPAYGRLWSLMGAALDQGEQYADARRHYERALQITPNDSTVLANMGLSYALEGNAVVAEQWLRRAAAQPGASAGVAQNLDLVLQLQGKSSENKKAEPKTSQPQFAQQPTWSRSNIKGPNLQGNNTPNAYNRPPSAPQGYSSHSAQGTLSNGQSFSVSNGTPRSASDAARMAAKQLQGRKMTIPAGQPVPSSSMLQQQGGQSHAMPPRQMTPHQMQTRQTPQRPMPPVGYAPQQQPYQQVPQGYYNNPHYRAPQTQQPQRRGPARQR